MAKKVKVKTHSGAKKRFKLTANGKVKYQHTNKRHRLTQKDTKRKRHLRSGAIMQEAQARNVRRMIIK